MFNASLRNIVIALVTSAALLGVAFYQRYETPHHGSSVMFFILAAFICATAIRLRATSVYEPREKAVDRLRSFGGAPIFTKCAKVRHPLLIDFPAQHRN